MEEHEKRIGDLELERFCLLPKDAGNCLDYMNRWYFDTKTGKCLKFVYSGCLGNANNFETEDDCQKKCFSWGDDYRIPPEIEPRGKDHVNNLLQYTVWFTSMNPNYLIRLKKCRF